MSTKSEKNSFKGSLKLDLEVSYQDGKMSLLSVKNFDFTLSEEEVESRVIYSNAEPTKSWIDYNLIKISGRSEISKLLKPHSIVAVCYKNKSYSAKMHSTIPGRFDSLSGLYRDNPELANAKVVHFFFHSSSYKIVIKKELEYDDAIQILESRGEYAAITLLQLYLTEKSTKSGWDGHLRKHFPQIASELKLF